MLISLGFSKEQNFHKLTHVLLGLDFQLVKLFTFIIEQAIRIVHPIGWRREMTLGAIWFEKWHGGKVSSYGTDLQQNDRITISVQILFCTR